MLTEKKYPLSQEMISKMLKRKLEVDHESLQAFKLLRFIRSQVTSPNSFSALAHEVDDEVVDNIYDESANILNPDDSS
ncbi:hypothetical protein Tco_0263633, partial [Tanacetum coccineum]